MPAEERMTLVRRMITSYADDRVLYLHRSILIVRCLEWTFSDDDVRTQIELERIVVGEECTIARWEFGVAWDDISLNHLAINRLSGCNLRDTIVFDAELLQMAESIDGDSSDEVVKDFQIRIARL